MLHIFLIIILCGISQVICAYDVHNPLERVHDSMQVLIQTVVAEEKALSVSVAFSVTSLRMRTSFIELSTNKSLNELVALSEKNTDSCKNKTQPILESIDGLILELRKCAEGDIRAAHDWLMHLRYTNERLKHELGTKEFPALKDALNFLSGHFAFCSGKVHTYIDKINYTNCPEVTEKAIAEAKKLLGCNTPNVQ